MVTGRVEMLSTEFVLGWAEIFEQGRTYVYAHIDGEVIGVAEANLHRPDLESQRMSGTLNALAYVIVFNCLLSEGQMHSVQVGIVGSEITFKRASAVRLDRVPSLQIFLVGSPRSGTSELGNTLATTLRLPWLGEGHAAPLFSDAATSLSGDPESDNGFVRHLTLQRYDRVAIEAARRAYYFMHASASFIDKTPGRPMISAMPFLLQCFPDAKVIYLMRNGISNILSRMVKFGGSFEGHCADWAAALETWGEIRSTIPSYLELRQEEMLADPHQVATSIATYLQLPDLIGLISTSLSAGSLERTGAGIGRDRLDQTGWTPGQEASFVRLCGPTMERFGYQLS